MATQYAFGKIVTSGLVLSLNAADRNSYSGSGNTWTDMSGNSNNGTLTNGPTFSSANGGSIVFDGVDDRVECGNASIVPNSWTVNCWLIHTKTTGVSVFVGRSGGPPNYDQNLILGWSAGSGFDSKFFVSGKTITGVYSPCTSSFVAVTGSIYNLVGCFDTTTTTLSLYVNGILNNTKVIGALFTTGSNLAIQVGCSDGTNPGNFMRGNIYTTQIYNRALSPLEVQQNYNAQKSRFGL